VAKKPSIAEAWKNSLYITECVGCERTFVTRGLSRVCPFCGYEYKQGWTRTDKDEKREANPRRKTHGLSLRSMVVHRDCERIVKLLEQEGPMSTSEIANAMGFGNIKTLARLNKLAKEGSVAIVGKKGKAYLWGLVETSECVETKVRE